MSAPDTPEALIKLAVYSVVVHCPAAWDDDDWSDEQATGLDDLFTAAGQLLTAMVKEKFPELHVELHT